MAKILPIISKIVLTKNFVSISKAAKFLGVSADTLRNWEKQGKLLPSRTHGGARRYSSSELTALKREIHPFVVKKRGLVTISQAAKALQVSADTLRNWDKKGLVEAGRSKGGSRRFTREEIQRLQNELGIKEPIIAKKKIINEPVKFARKNQSFSFPWSKLAFSGVFILLVVAAGGLFTFYISPLEKKIDKSAKLMSAAVASIENLQKGVLGIQAQTDVQPQPTPLALPSNLDTNFANFKNQGLNVASIKAPLSFNEANEELDCPTCLTSLPDFVSSIKSNDGVLSVSTIEDEVVVSLNFSQSNNWGGKQTFTGGIVVSGENAAIFATGNVGIGVTSPAARLQITGESGQLFDVSNSTASLFNINVSGNVGIGISAPAYKLDVAGGARFGCGSGNWNSGPATDCSDVAEIYHSDEEIDIGEIVVAGNEPQEVKKSHTPYQKGIIGVYSTSPGLLIGGQAVLGGSTSLSSGQIPVALTGRVPVKVSDENGPIEAGDYLTSSSIPGVAMKATKPGPVLGQAFEPFKPVSLEQNPDLEDTHLINFKLKFGKILSIINPTFADPENFLSSLSMDDQGNLIVPKIKVGSLILESGNSKLDLEAGSSSIDNQSSNTLASNSNLQSQESSINSSNTASYDLAAKIASLEEKIAQLISSIATTETNDVSSINSERVENEISNESSSSANLAEITSSASDSGVVAFAPPQNDITLELTPPDLLLASPSAVLADLSSQAQSSDKIFEDDNKISGDLNVFGKTTLSNTLVAGDFIVDGSLSLTGNSINSLGTLRLQNTQLAEAVDFFNGLVTIEKDGSLKAQTVTVAQFKVIANKISGSGGIAVGEKTVEIENPLIEPSSRILITPTVETDLTLAVTDKKEGKGFTVSRAKAVDQEVKFDFFIINETKDFDKTAFTK